jgi:hypothetical protein
MCNQDSPVSVVSLEHQKLYHSYELTFLTLSFSAVIISERCGFSCNKFVGCYHFWTLLFLLTQNVLILNSHFEFSFLIK